MKRSEYIRRVRSMLIERRDSLVRSLRNELSKEWSATPATNVRDYGDAASDSEFRELMAELANADARDLRQINEAIARADEGAHGVCSACQQNIPIIRLKALPYATRCVRCQESFDAGEASERSGTGSSKVETEKVEISSDETIDFREPEREETFGITMFEPPLRNIEVPSFMDFEPDTAA